LANELKKGISHNGNISHLNNSKTGKGAVIKINDIKANENNNDINDHSAFSDRKLNTNFKVIFFVCQR